VRESNPPPTDCHTEPDGNGSSVDGMARVQRGTVGDMTAGLSLDPWTAALAAKLMAQNELVWDENGIQGSEREKRRLEFANRYRAHIQAGDLYCPYTAYPYFEWYAANGRVVLELEPWQVEIVKTTPTEPKTPAGLHGDERKRAEAFGAFMAELLKDFSRENRNDGGDGNVTGIVVSQCSGGAIAPRRVDGQLKIKGVE